jgi:hypothetical protein
LTLGAATTTFFCVFEGVARLVAGFLAGFAFAGTGLRARVACFFAAGRALDFAAFRAGALLATLLALTGCFGRAAFAFNGRRFAAVLADDCLVAVRLIPFATGLLM